VQPLTPAVEAGVLPDIAPCDVAAAMHPIYAGQSFVDPYRAVDTHGHLRVVSHPGQRDVVADYGIRELGYRRCDRSPLCEVLTVELGCGEPGGENSGNLWVKALVDPIVGEQDSPSLNRRPPGRISRELSTPERARNAKAGPSTYH
jgi:hypothetical protein